MTQEQQPAAPAPSAEEGALQCLAFIHQKLLITQFYPEQFAMADKSLKFIEALAKDLGEKVAASKKEDAADV